MNWHEYLHNRGVAPSVQPILLAVSGGPDSMAMAKLIYDHWQSCPQPKQAIRALIIDHGIRDSSAEEAKITLERVQAMGLSCRIERLREKAPKTGIQSWARQKRYQALWRDAVRDNAAIITAHHAEDQAETVLMRLSRGSGFNGLGGMRVQSHYKGVLVLRPFIDVSKTALLKAGFENKSIANHSVSDPSNEDEKFERVQWRNQQDGLAQFEFSVDNLHRFAQSNARLSDYIQSDILSLKDTVFGFGRYGQAWLDLAKFQVLPRFYQFNTVSLIVRSLGLSAFAPKLDALNRLLNWMFLEKGQKRTLGGLEFARRHTKGQDLIWVYPEAERPWQQIVCDAGHHLIDERWHVYVPQKSLITPLGARGYASIKNTSSFEGINQIGAPARSFWRLPLIIPCKPREAGNATKTHNFVAKDTWSALEDGANIPHVIGYDEILSNHNEAVMRFVGDVKT